MTKQFLQETNFQDDPEMPERRAKDQINNIRKRWEVKEEDEVPEYLND